ncbi:MAG: coenzyme F420-0:L-glutamate ligase [Anaerolineae bacterium]
MRVESIRTHAITTADHDLLAILDAYVPPVADGGVLAITSKIVAICEGRVVPAHAAEKQALVEQEAEWFLPQTSSRYNVSLTLKRDLLIAAAGIDASNAGGHYVLWPSDPQGAANSARAHLARRLGLHRFGVIITDSKTTPLRWGVTGAAIAHSGFQAVNDLIGEPDIFGRPLEMTRVHVADGLAGAAVLVMGEAAEQTPLAVITDVPFVCFQDRDPTVEELERLRIEPADDLYAPLLQAVPWRRGGHAD